MDSELRADFEGVILKIKEEIDWLNKQTKPSATDIFWAVRYMSLLPDWLKELNRIAMALDAAAEKEEAKYGR